MTHEEIKSGLEIFKLIHKSDIEITDWDDNNNYEIAYPDGTKEWLGEIEAIEVIHNEIAYLNE